MFEDEEWKPVAEPHLSHYWISTHGRVKHEDRPDQARRVTLNDKGFPIITLYGADSKTRYLRQINVLVAMAFIEHPAWDDLNNPKTTAVWHIDGDWTNCHVNNLKWETRPRVLEWNEMHRRQRPSMSTPKVKNNRSGIVYENAFECAMEEGYLESDIVWRIERQARHTEDDEARYRYIWEGKDT